jgi:hypothetical protein
MLDIRLPPMASMHATTPSQRPQPSRRRTSAIQWMTLLAVLVSLLSVVSAQHLEAQAGVHDSLHFRRLAERGEIHIDRQDPPPRPQAYLERRQAGTASTTSSTSSTLTTSASPTTSDSAISGVQTIVASNATSSAAATFTPITNSSSTDATSTTTSTSSRTAVPTALPSPFDTSIGSNFTSQACPHFFNSFLNNATFQSCVPVSLLLQNSNSFFKASRSIVALTATLQAACAASLPICQPLMTSLASQLVSSDNCAQDYANQNPLVAQAHAGLVAYQPVYLATCLKSNDTGNYCFADAITNQANPSDAYPYYAAIGLNLPAAARPTCNNCLQSTMAIFAGYARDKMQLLSTTYIPTAQQIDLNCGPTFANITVPVGTVSSGGDILRTASWMTAAVGVMMFSLL